MGAIATGNLEAVIDQVVLIAAGNGDRIGIGRRHLRRRFGFQQRNRHGGFGIAGHRILDAGDGNIVLLYGNSDRERQTELVHRHQDAVDSQQWKRVDQDSSAGRQIV